MWPPHHSYFDLLADDLCSCREMTAKQKSCCPSLVTIEIGEKVPRCARESGSLHVGSAEKKTKTSIPSKQDPMLKWGGRPEEDDSDHKHGVRCLNGVQIECGLTSG